jgi:hypothetical protein
MYFNTLFRKVKIKRVVFHLYFLSLLKLQTNNNLRFRGT